MSNLNTPQSLPSLASQPFAARLQRALHHLRLGRPVILMDDFDRENEADLIVAADKLTVPVMAQLIRDGSGIVCLCLPGETLDRLELPPMVTRNQSRFATAFTVSIEARDGVSTGVSAVDRVTTIRAAISPTAQSEDIVSPGHVFRCARSRWRADATRSHRRLGRPGRAGRPAPGRRAVRTDEPRRHHDARRLA